LHILYWKDFDRMNEEELKSSKEFSHRCVKLALLKTLMSVHFGWNLSLMRSL